MDHLGIDRDESSMAKVIVQIGQTLQLEVVAEGVERQEQVESLQRTRLRQRSGVPPRQAHECEGRDRTGHGEARRFREANVPLTWVELRDSNP